MNNVCNRYFIMLALLMGMSSALAQSHKGISFQGVVKLPSGEYPTRSGLTVNARILSPTNCILREEQFSGVNVSNGYINISIGTGAAGSYDPGFTMKQVMDNSKVISGLTCLDIDGSVNGGVTSFNPATTNGARKFRLSLTIDSTPVVADFNMRAMAYAVNAETLNGKGESDFINTSASVTQSAVENWFASAVMGQIMAGTYVAPSATTAGNVSGTVAVANGGTGATTASGAVTNLLPSQGGNSGRFLTTNGSNVSWAVIPSAPVTSVASRTGDVVLSSSDISDFSTAADARITAQKAQVNGLASLNASGKVPSSQLALTASDIPSLDASKITTGTISSALLPASANIWQSGAGGAVYYDSGNVGIGTDTPGAKLDVYGGALTVRSGAITPISNITGGVISSTGTDAAPGYFKAASWSSQPASGQIVGSYRFGSPIVDFAKIEGLTTENHNPGRGTALRFFTTPNGSGSPAESFRIDSGGNVGIGTANPTFKLSISGTASTADRKIGINDTQVVYLPDQTNFTGSVFVGDGGGSLAHTSGNEGFYNTGLGVGSLVNNSTGYNNTAVGGVALKFNTTGRYNTAVGAVAMLSNTTGNNNTAVGNSSMALNTTGSNNVANGYGALNSNTTGSENTAAGNVALNSNTTGTQNTALGSYALQANTTGVQNTATGYYALQNSRIGNYNTAVGTYSLQGSNTPANNTGIQNTALGHSSLNGISSGSGNIGLGYNAGSAITTGSYNVIVGSNTGAAVATSSNNILIADGAGNERLRVDSSGNVGIGTTPNAKLDVAGQVKITGGSPGAGKVLTSDASGLATWETPSAGGSGTVTGVSSGNNYLTVTNGSVAPVVTANVGTAANTLAAGDDSRFTNARTPTGSAGGDLSGTYPNPSVAKINGNAVASTTPAAGQVMVWNAAQYSPVNFGVSHLLSATGAQQFANSACTTSQTLTWSSLTDTFTCANITGLNASTITAGTIDSARLPASATAWVDGGSGTLYYNGGNVGMGTANPTNALTVAVSNAAWPDAAIKVSNSIATRFTQIEYAGTGRTWTTGVGNASESGYNVANKYFIYDLVADAMRFVVDTSGNVGIGTATPTSKLHIVNGTNVVRFNDGAGAVTPNISIESTVGKAMALVAGTNGSAFTFDNSGNFYIGGDSHANIAAGTTSGGTYYMTVSDVGNVGIGTVNPGSALEINAPAANAFVTQMKVTDGTTGGYWALSEGASGAAVYLPTYEFRSAGLNGFGGVIVGKIPAANDVYTANYAAIALDGRIDGGGALVNSNLLSVRNNGAPVATVKASGNVGIGTTDPKAKLDVSGEVRTGNSGLACSATTEGAQRYNSTDKVMEYCNGTVWTDFSPSGTQCGAVDGSGSVVKLCKGLNPTTSCPANYSKYELLAADSSVFQTTCVKQ